MTEKKRCSKCEQERRLGDFHKKSYGSRDGRQSRCKFCVKGDDATPERKAQKRAAWSSPEGRLRDRAKVLRRHGLTPADYDTMLAKQGGVCKICGRGPQGDRLHVDHDHATGKVRGILCVSCNTTLGKLETYMAKFLDYLGVTA
jgi:hypothetical protein